MKKYLICDAEVSTIDGIDVPVEMWIEHAEVTVRELERLDTEIIAMYSLYKHLESIDRENEDNLPW